MPAPERPDAVPDQRRLRDRPGAPPRWPRPVTQEPERVTLREFGDEAEGEVLVAPALVQPARAELRKRPVGHLDLLRRSHHLLAAAHAGQFPSLPDVVEWAELAAAEPQDLLELEAEF